MSQTKMVLRVNKKNEEIDIGFFLRVCNVYRGGFDLIA